MAGLILAAINPDNTPHGYNWTFAFPMLLFIIIAGVLYYLFGRPHRRVPPQPVTAATSSRPQPPRGAHRAASDAAGSASSEGTASAEGSAAESGETGQDTGAQE